MEICIIHQKKDIWHNSNGLLTQAYNEGYYAKKYGKKSKDNPYESSGHPRDATIDDDMNHYWEKGFDDYEL